MPTDVMSTSRGCGLFLPSVKNKPCDAEIKSGFLVLSRSGLWQNVRVVVYQTSLEHFAVIYPRKRLSKPIGVDNLKNTWVERGESFTGFMVRHKGMDSEVTTKFLCAERDIEGWMSAFTCRNADKMSHMPVLIEADECS